MKTQKPLSAVEREGQPWTRAELMARLRTAGWTREDGPAAVYTSPEGLRFHLDEYRAGVGILWIHYAFRRCLPAAGDGILSARKLEPAAFPRPRLNETTERVYQFVLDYKRKYAGESPTFQEIMKGARLSTKSLVAFHLQSLDEKGLLVVERDIERRACRIAVPGAVWTFEGGVITGWDK